VTVTRRIQLCAVAVLLVVVLVVTTVLTLHVLTLSSNSRADRLVEVGDLLAGGTFLLAVLAALVALLAYAVATGNPDLKFQVTFEFSKPNLPIFNAFRTQEGWLKAQPFKQTSGTISLKNVSRRYTARNPAVIVRLNGLVFQQGDFAQTPGWVTIGFANTIGVTAVQWDGGPAYYIHGNSIRQLPAVSFQGLTRVPAWNDDPSLSIELLADGGYRRTLIIPVEFTVDEKPQFYPLETEEPPLWR
jgi:hypothetical protein